MSNKKSSFQSVRYRWVRDKKGEVSVHNVVLAVVLKMRTMKNSAWIQAGKGKLALRFAFWMRLRSADLHLYMELAFWLYYVIILLEAMRTYRWNSRVYSWNGPKLSSYFFKWVWGCFDGRNFGFSLKIRKLIFLFSTSGGGDFGVITLGVLYQTQWWNGDVGDSVVARNAHTDFALLQSMWSVCIL